VAKGRIQVHTVVLDVYDFFPTTRYFGILKKDTVYYKGYSVNLKWPRNLAENGFAQNYTVYGDYSYTENVNYDIPFFGVGKKPPSPWYPSSCIGRNFNPNPDGTKTVDYCGLPFSD
jgi:hypothetical protein